MTRQLIAADLFAGAGGTSSGAESTGAARVRFAVNHWAVAVETHSANFPDARHINSRLDQVSPSECPKIDLLFASPECTHHSRARGGRPTSDQQRSGAWDVLKWIEYHRPSWVVIENVREFEQWGPIGEHGRPLPSKRGAFVGITRPGNWQQHQKEIPMVLTKQLITSHELNHLTVRCNSKALAGETSYALEVAELPRLLMAARIGLAVVEFWKSEGADELKELCKLIRHLEP